MRKTSNILLAAIILVLAALSCSRGNKATLSGILEEGAGEVITLEKLDVNRTIVIDSVKTDRAGRFSLKVELEEGELFILKDREGNLINLLLYPGDEVELVTRASAFGKEYRLTGSEESENIRTLVRQLETTRSRMDSIQNIAAGIDDPDSGEMLQLRRAFADIMVQQKRFNIRYIVEHMGDLSSIYALYQKYDEESMILGAENDLPYFTAVADSLGTTHPGSSLTSSLKADIRSREFSFKQNHQLNRLMEMAEVSTGYIDLRIADRDGKEIALSSQEGKVVLLVFWSSASEASISALLGLKSTYERYHPKGFEVYAVGLEGNKVNWMQAMDFNEFNWINVSELNFPESESALKYNVRTMPASFLINRQGDIMASNLWGRQLETWLDNLL